MEQEQESRTYIIIDKHHHWKPLYRSQQSGDRLSNNTNHWCNIDSTPTSVCLYTRTYKLHRW